MKHMREGKEITPSQTATVPSSPEGERLKYQEEIEQLERDYLGKLLEDPKTREYRALMNRVYAARFAEAVVRRFGYVEGEEVYISFDDLLPSSERSESLHIFNTQNFKPDNIFSNIAPGSQSHNPILRHISASGKVGENYPYWIYLHNYKMIFSASLARRFLEVAEQTIEGEVTVPDSDSSNETQ